MKKGGLKKGLIALLLVAVVVAIVLISSSDSGNNGYVVRGFFDNGSFMVKGEQVRVAGANVGEVESVGVSLPGEIDSYEHGKPEAVPGKAVIVMNIEDPGFQDFREDATCLIRPQSLIGEKYLDCRPTLPRAPSSKPPPPLKKIPEGQPGAGERLLPVENNSTSVDPDLINDIHSLPYAQRFRLIFNELGATLAGRGSDIAAAVKRANPDLRDADRLLEILHQQRDELAQLATNSERVTRPLAEQRQHVAGFLANAGAAGQATAERGPELEASLSKFPQFLREFRTTMHNLKGFSDAATPVFSNLDQATPALTEATRNLSPFTAASTVALKSFGNAAEASGPTFRASDPVVKKARDVARTGVSPTTSLSKFLVSTQKTGGFDNLVDLIYNGTGATNEFDKYGHLIRSLVKLTDCAEYLTKAKSGCKATFANEGGASSFDANSIYDRIQREMAQRSGGTASTTLGPSTFLNPSTPAEPTPELGEGEGLGGEPLGGEGEEEEETAEETAEVEEAAPRAGTSSSQRALLNYLLGP
jgi:ABC-type transporter Mla subunit MlaD